MKAMAGAPMLVRLPEWGRPIFTIAAGVVLGAFAAGVGPQLVTAFDRPACADTVMRAVATDQTIQGTFNCFDKEMQLGLLSIGVDSDSAFAARIGQAGDYHFVRKTLDGGYVYEYDRPTTPHDSVQGAVSALGLPQMRSDLRHGNFLAAFNVKHDVPLAWAEITGKTQNAESHLFTVYLGPDGKITAIK
jgi:hypothetical protein